METNQVETATATATAADEASSSSPIPPTDHRVKSLHKIMTRVPSPDLDKALSSSGVEPLPELVVPVLRLSYSSPSSAAGFFKWVRRSVKHTPDAWNLMIEILGKSALFDEMWKAMRAMLDQPGVISLTTFSLAFDSYCSAGRFEEAIKTFKVMERFGIVPDILAVNSLLTSMCRHSGHTSDAADFLDQVKEEIEPDIHTFTILLEGWEKEANAVRSKRTFSEMVKLLGWRKDNVQAHDAFLITLVRGYQIDNSIEYLKTMKTNNCLPGSKFFKIAMDVLLKKKDFENATFLWEAMVVEGKTVPNFETYHSMIVLSCENDDVTRAYNLLDEMPFKGLFPDSTTYNAIFDCLVRAKKAKEAEKFFFEMKKNEKVPSSSTCALAIRMFFEEFDPITANEVWGFVKEEKVLQVEDCVREMIIGLLNLERWREVRLYVEEIVDDGIGIRLSTLDSLKSRFYKAGLNSFFDRLVRKLKYSR